MEQEAIIYVAGHRGLVGSAIVRALQQAGHTSIITRTHAQCDLTDQAQVNDFFAHQKPQYVVLAAAKVGGIHANDIRPAEFIRDNLLIQSNIIDAAYRNGARKLLFLGSSCIYPKFAPQPIREEHLLTGELEPTNQWYAVAKIAGLKMCQAYRRQYGFNAISLMPTNLYGPGDNFDLVSAHVLPALLRKFHEAKLTGAPEVSVWGSGTPRREFLHVDDLAQASLFLMDNYDEEDIINVGVGTDISIAELAEIIQDIVGYKGNVIYDRNKPDGTPRKLLDVSRLTGKGWTAGISLREGIASTYSWFVNNSPC
ncbi:GDP-L-fucose synthase [Desulfovibrio ferrophilus]|uniref:GDP-L-fucose synthase n=1 Tax=Desulfovibrio ferrophilus TaxID=241368 RepID=A0A2Z6B0L7_9BACT|nr:GDP-L-fucose synthase [Desulfovibrio ferrophilus]BBD09024.1 GDP-L-fucose synthetase-related [Desulfovibrio ferrophilus]